MEAAVRPSLEPSQSNSAPSTSTSVWSAPPAVRVSQHHSSSPVPKKKHKMQVAKRGCSPTVKRIKHGEHSGVRPESGHSSATAPWAAVSTPPRRKGPLSPVPDHPSALEGQCSTTRITILSTRVVAKNLLALLVPLLLTVQASVPGSRREHAALGSHLVPASSVPSRSLLALMLVFPPQHHSQAPVGTTPP